VEIADPPRLGLLIEADECEAGGRGEPFGRQIQSPR
jgi:hypothetical protein